MVAGYAVDCSERHWFYDSGCLVGAPRSPRVVAVLAIRVRSRCTGRGTRVLRRGDPGYSADLDRDGDGVACEVRPR